MSEPEWSLYQDDSGEYHSVAHLEEDTSFEVVGGGVQQLSAGSYVTRADNPSYVESFDESRFSELNWTPVTWEAGTGEPETKSRSSRSRGAKSEETT